MADGVFAGVALSAGLEVVALSGLDAPALAVAAWRGMALRVVPLDDRRPPASYAPLLGLLTECTEWMGGPTSGFVSTLEPLESPLHS